MISLKKECLSKIAGEFERIYFATAISKDRTLKRNFQFLQRKYTSELVSELSQKRKLKHEYMEFFLNAHLNILDEKWFTDACYGTSVKDVIYCLPNLSILILPYTCSDDILKNIAEFCPKIVEINASYSPITDTGLKYLCKNENGKVPCPALKKLSIFLSNVTDDGLMHLIQNLPSLEEIDHKNVPLILYFLHEKDLHRLEKLPSYNLIHLSLCAHWKLPYYTELFKICLTVCPRLKSLDCHISEKRQLDLFNNTSLEKLDISIFLKSRLDVNNFLKNNGRNLVSLNIFNCIMSISATAENCPKLRHLFIIDVTFLEEQDNTRTAFPHLIQCTFKNITADCATDKAMEAFLMSSPKLEQLTFTSCYLSPEMKHHLLKCCENRLLKCITFFCTFVEMHILKDILLSCPSLKTLRLENCYFELNGKMQLTEFIKELPNKPEIYVDNYCINDYDYSYEFDDYMDRF